MSDMRVCPICYGNMILLHNYWDFTCYWQCIDCGNVEKVKKDEDA